MAVRQPKQQKRSSRSSLAERTQRTSSNSLRRDHAGYPPSYPIPSDDMNNFDPECAICGAPPSAKCGCESIALDKAIRMAEERMMANHFLKVRDWVRLHAQDYILKYYEALSERKKDDHQRHLEYLQEQAHRYYGYPVRVPPDQILMANQRLREGLDECWKQSVNRYPEVLEYYYSLVDFKMPDDRDPAVCDPSLAALAGAAAPRMREPRPIPVERRESRRSGRGSTPLPEDRERPRQRPGQSRSSFSSMPGAYTGY